MFTCIKCEKSLDHAFGDINGLKIENSRDIQPYNGLHFFTYGHYGSTIFDPMGTGEILNIIVCDKCVEDYFKNGNGYKTQLPSYEVISNEI